MIGSQIKKYLTDNGIKQSFVCERADIKPDRMSVICSGNARIEAYEYIKICRALGVNYDTFIFEGEEE